MKLQQTKPEKDKNHSERLKKGVNQFAKYSGLAFQMGGVIFITVWGGQKLDEITASKTPVFTIVLSLLGVIGAIYVAIKDFINIK